MSYSSATTAGPGGLTKVRSFSRFEPADSTPLRSRTNTLSNEATGPMLSTGDDVDEPKPSASGAAAMKRQDSIAASVTSGTTSMTHSPDIENFPENFDELPIELISLTDRFITSLTTARVYPTPPTVDKLSDLFQDFYLQAESHISTHVQELRSRHYRDSSPAPSISSRSSARKASRDAPDRRPSGQQMLTSTELHERRRARKLLDYKRGALEEAIEKKVCEEIYDRIWRHRSTLDEMRDEKLRSRTAGLAVMGVGLKELGVDLKLTPESAEWVEKARASLCQMDAMHYPLGKLQSLASAHHSVVELLATCHQGSSSADEILPTLIYVLIGSPVDQMNLISNLHFVQRFRTASKMSGEAAYCLTNLEAAITFLETVDITSLGIQDDSESSGKRDSNSPVKATASSDSASESAQRPPLHRAGGSQGSVSKSKPSSALTIEIKPSPPTSPAPATAKRPLSALFQGQAALGAAGDAMRTTANEGLQNIGTALDKSFNFMFGRLREHSVSGATSNSNTVVVAPKTLDDARKLVSPKAMVDEDGLLSENSSITETDEQPPLKEDRILDMITGSRAARDRSADSAGSSASGAKRPGLAPDSRASSGAANLGASPPMSTSAAMESMKSLGTSLNPLNRFAGMRFGRSSPVPANYPHPLEAAGKDAILATPLGRIEPPLQQFVEMNDPLQLRLLDVAVLLKDYQRIADALKARGLV